MVLKDQGGGIISELAAQQAMQQTQIVLSTVGIPKDSLLFQYKYALKGFSAKLTPGQADLLGNHTLIDRVSQARMFQTGISGTKAAAPTSGSFMSAMSGQSTPWGVQRVGGPFDGTGKRAWIIDSGIDLDHPDLNVDVANSVSFRANETADDDFGHGTYAAGILAAKDNSQNVVGVAAGATVVSINVCNSLGNCPEPGYLNGIDYVANQAAPDDIVNISIWGSVDPDVDDAILNAVQNGVRMTLIAGNAAAGANNYSPGRVNHPNIWTMSAFDDTDRFATSFSNFGNPPIEFGGPGVDIPSLRIGGGSGLGFGGLSGAKDGTSWAAPHIAGLLLVLGNGPVTDGFVSNDPDNDPDPIASGRLNEPFVLASVENDIAHIDSFPVPQADRYAVYERDNGDQNPTFAKVAEVTTTEYDGLPLNQDNAGDPRWISNTVDYRVVALSNAEYKNSFVSNTQSFTYWDLPTFPGGNSLQSGGEDTE